MIAALKSFSALGEEFSPSFYTNLLKMEFHVLVDIVVKAILIKTGIYDILTKETVLIMTAITSWIQFNWDCIFFKAISDMVQKRFLLVLLFRLENFSRIVVFSYTDENNVISTTIIDVENVVAL